MESTSPDKFSFMSLDGLAMEDQEKLQSILFGAEKEKESPSKSGSQSPTSQNRHVFNVHAQVFVPKSTQQQVHMLVGAPYVQYDSLAHMQHVAAQNHMAHQQVIPNHMVQNHVVQHNHMAQMMNHMQQQQQQHLAMNHVQVQQPAHNMQVHQQHQNQQQQHHQQQQRAHHEQQQMQHQPQQQQPRQHENQALQQKQQQQAQQQQNQHPQQHREEHHNNVNHYNSYRGRPSRYQNVGSSRFQDRHGQGDWRYGNNGGRQNNHYGNKRITVLQNPNSRRYHNGGGVPGDGRLGPRFFRDYKDYGQGDGRRDRHRRAEEDINSNTVKLQNGLEPKMDARSSPDESDDERIIVSLNSGAQSPSNVKWPSDDSKTCSPQSRSLSPASSAHSEIKSPVSSKNDKKPVVLQDNDLDMSAALVNSMERTSKNVEFARESYRGRGRYDRPRYEGRGRQDRGGPSRDFSDAWWPREEDGGDDNWKSIEPDTEWSACAYSGESGGSCNYATAAAQETKTPTQPANEENVKDNEASGETSTETEPQPDLKEEEVKAEPIPAEPKVSDPAPVTEAKTSPRPVEAAPVAAKPPRPTPPPATDKPASKTSDTAPQPPPPAPPTQPLIPPPRKSWAALVSHNLPAQPALVIRDQSPPLKPAETNHVQAPTQEEEEPEETGDKSQDKLVKKMREYLRSAALHHRPPSVYPRGLINRANWCYVNATLQALLACPPFYNLFHNIPHLQLKDRGQSCTPVIDSICEFVDEFKFMKPQPNRNKNREQPTIATGEPFAPDYVYRMLLKLKSTEAFKQGRQEDAEEFLTCVLNHMHDELLAITNNNNNNQQNEDQKLDEAQEEAAAGDDWEQVGRKKKAVITRSNEMPRSLVSDIFCGQIRSVLRSSGSRESATLEPFFTLPLDIQQEKIRSVKDALNGLVSRESIQGFTCSKTKEEVEATRCQMLELLPPVLVLHLKCFIYDKNGGCQKLNKEIEYTVDLEVSKEIISPVARGKIRDHQRSYKLFAVVYHRGKTLQGGHYTTDVYHSGINGWIRIDDHNISVVPVGQVLKYEQPYMPYLLYYRRHDSLGPDRGNQKN